MKRSIVFVVSVVLFLCGITYAVVPVPQKINVQGMATDDAGDPLVSPDDLTFKLYDVSVGGASLWDVTINDYEFDHGLFNVELEIPSAQFTSSANRWLGVTIGIGSELSPRIQLISVPYAYMAEVAYSVLSAPASGGGWVDEGTEVVLQTSTNEVGIGTSNPAVNLHVDGGDDVEATIAGGGYFYIGSSIGDHLAFDDNEIMAKGSGTSSSTLYFQNDGGKSSFMDVVWIRGDGSPTYPTTDEGMELVYDPDLDRGAIQVYNRNTSSWGELTFGSANVGIGVSNPSARLHVEDNNSTRVLDVTNNNIGSVSQVVNFERTQPVPSANDILQILVASGSSSTMQFIECTRGTDAEFKVNGNGNVYADGSYTGPADFSEMIAVSTGAFTAEPGDVMVIDPKNTRSTVKSTEPRSTLVAGIYSTRPGFVGSERDWDKPAAKADEESDTYTLDDMAKEFNEIPLAVVGIVPCKVSAENGPISPGDLLVTSSTPGHAMRDDNPKVGTVLGKALEPLTSGTGVIKVLVSLH